MDLQRAEIRVVGVVQGIGFRPFVYGQAVKHDLTGYVLNTGNSAVQIVVEGDKRKIIEFIESIKNEKPHLAVIDSITTKWVPGTGEFSSFTIRFSRDEKSGGGSIIPPDIAICDACMKDIYDPQSRHYRYPFTCCAICGPRYTTIVDTPYDRERTTMREFPLCPECEREFNDPRYRRYNAQTICCPRCGPQFRLLDQSGHEVKVKDVFAEAVRLLNEGAIIAVKGLGGIHLAVRAGLEEQVLRLRKLRGKSAKPLAVMSPNLSTIREYAVVTSNTEKLLTSWRRPIVVIPKRRPFPLADSLSPGLDTIGVMLPYSAIYQLLFDGLNDLALVMTSANPPGLPTIIHATAFQKHFMHMADYLLTHNRRIHQRCDDSVVIAFEDHGLIVRRSRGYTPEPIETSSRGPPILAFGAREKNTGAIYINNRIFLTQHIGDIDNLETLEFLQSSLTHLQKLLRLEQNQYHAIGCDLHPDFLTTQHAENVARDQDVPLVRVQHHHAHLASLLADHKLPAEEEIVGICCDGAGYGPDRTIWGGEILFGNASSYQRKGHLRPHPMPGGDLATKYPMRMLIGILSTKYSPGELHERFEGTARIALPHGLAELRVTLNQAGQPHTPRTSSTGRVLDAIAALLGVCYERTYEGEPAIRLEAAANAANQESIPNLTIPSTVKRKTIILETGDLLAQVLELSEKYEAPRLALAAHHALGRALAEAAVTIARQTGTQYIGFTGGAAYNKILTRTIRKIVEEGGFTFLMHHHVPPGDAGVSVGQTVVARSTIMES